MYNPRLSFDNLGMMICFHRKYSLGDNHEYKNPREFLFDLLEETVGDTEKAEKILEETCRLFEYQKDADNKILEIVSDKFIVLPVYLMDHSGLSISTSDFNDRWDSGLVGWIYVEREKAKEELGEERYENRARIVLIDEVNLFNEYLNSDEGD